MSERYKPKTIVKNEKRLYTFYVSDNNGERIELLRSIKSRPKDIYDWQISKKFRLDKDIFLYICGVLCSKETYQEIMEEIKAVNIWDDPPHTLV